VRLIIGKAARKVEARQRRLIALWLRVVPYALAKAIKSGRLARSDEWLMWDMTLPRMLTIDYGRESYATNAELRAGVTSMAEIVGREGRDWRDVLRSRIQEQRFIMDECASAGVDPATVSDLFQVGPSQQGEPEQ
jgi:capsid protein